MDQGDDGTPVNDFAKTAKSIGAAPSSPCPKCGIRPRRGAGGTRGYCRECDRDWHRADAVRKKSRRSNCVKCKEPKLPGKECRRCKVVRAAGYGERYLQQHYPGFAEIIAAAVSVEERLRLFANTYWSHSKSLSSHFPPPSQLFAGLDPALDERLKREHRDKDVALCQALAALPVTNQQEFLELYLADPADAQHWAALPRWKRPIRKGDADDIQIWKFFTIHRLCMEQAARDAAPWPMSSQGAQLSQTFGTIRYLTPRGLQKLVDVMGTYGDMLQYGRELGDVTKKPWEDSK